MSAAEKAARLLSEGAVAVLVVSSRHVVAVVRGDTGVRRVTYGAGAWSCTCPAFGRCSHVAAVQLVTSVVTLPGWARAAGLEPAGE